MFDRSPRLPCPGRVLVVDDQAPNRRLVAALLHAEGHEVVQTGTAAAAMDALRRAPYDVVLLDIMMPDVDGYAVLAQIRADEALRDLPVVMVSALHDVDNLVKSIERGADDYLTKPINATVLRARVSASVERSQARARERQLLSDLQAERDRAEQLLHNILPPSVAARLKAGHATIADTVEAATVVFVDVVGFTQLSAHTSPEQLVAYLNRLFGAFDRIAAQVGIEKIKTVGDAYLAVAGVPEPRADHVAAAVQFAHAASVHAQNITGPDGEPLRVRVGVHTGPLVAGVVGLHKFAYDVWGDVVNTAARLQQACEPGRVLLSHDVLNRLCDKTWHVGKSVDLDLKGKGRVSAAYLVEA